MPLKKEKFKKNERKCYEVAARLNDSLGLALPFPRIFFCSSFALFSSRFVLFLSTINFFLLFLFPSFHLFHHFGLHNFLGFFNTTHNFGFNFFTSSFEFFLHTFGYQFLNTFIGLLLNIFGL